MLFFSLKKFVLATAMASMSVVVGMNSQLALASAPVVKTPAPGYFRLMLGDFEVTAINDGTVTLPVEQLLVQSHENTHEALAHNFLNTPLETSVNTFLINTGNKLVLIDVGAGSLFGPTLGKFVSNLKASGYDPVQIDEIYITHMHTDHIGGLIANNELVFPNATIYADKKEANFWLSQSNMDKAPAEQKDFYINAMAALNPYKTAKQFVPFKEELSSTPGIKSYSSYGHTAGHTIYEVESKGQKLVLIGDLIHVAAVQFDHPEVTITFDSDQKKAAATRKKIFKDLAKEGTLIGASHIQFPGLGHLRKEGKSYEWFPVNFTQMH